MNNKNMDVVCGLIILDKKILLAQRPLHKSHGGYWEFPGGKVQGNESLEHALQRELFEELKLQITKPTFLGTTEHHEIKLHSFLTTPISTYCPQEHRATSWVTYGFLSQYKLCPTDQITIKAFKNKILSFLDPVSFSSKMEPGS